MIPQPDKTPGNTEWFVHDRFGMFIHWGLYALPARHEWVMSYEKIPVQVYEKYFTTQENGQKPQKKRV
jgi:alpha-L-fucosidase